MSKTVGMKRYHCKRCGTRLLGERMYHTTCRPCHDHYVWGNIPQKKHKSKLRLIRSWMGQKPKNRRQRKGARK